ncbi:uncharacterized protein LOC111241178 isoform X3 [Vigna radiata var. radiata]|uniref:Uncharacterized protein LOC111241178 isoform X3 n=1 Tax=Vigna radiata var. radiata TaxID=3916 RepID=A0A3Q0ERU5_VIGRR|nr:uncharacterized protein LOC111241178 isoform X3 [Vigna radiata var. radiata]
MKKKVVIISLEAFMRARLRKKTLKVSMAQLLPRTLYLTTKIHATSVTLDYQLLDSHLWQTPIFYSMTIMSLILIGWIFVAGTFILCGIFLFLHNNSFTNSILAGAGYVVHLSQPRLLELSQGCT